MKDDSEQSTADPEHQQTSVAGESRGHDLARSPKPGFLGRIRAILVGFFVAVSPTLILCSVLYEDYAYRVGTPTTATNVVCVDHTVDRFTRYQHNQQRCTAWWSLGGQSNYGEVVGVDHSGGSMDVRVYYGTAYTANVVMHRIVPVGLLAVGGVLFAVGFRYESRRAARARARAMEDKKDPTIREVRCWACQHVQKVPVSQEAFLCEQCGAHLHRLDPPAKGT